MTRTFKTMPHRRAGLAITLSCLLALVIGVFGLSACGDDTSTTTSTDAPDYLSLAKDACSWSKLEEQGLVIKYTTAEATSGSAFQTLGLDYVLEGSTGGRKFTLLHGYDQQYQCEAKYLRYNGSWYSQFAGFTATRFMMSSDLWSSSINYPNPSMFDSFSPKLVSDVKNDDGTYSLVYQITPKNDDDVWGDTFSSYLSSGVKHLYWGLTLDSSYRPISETLATDAGLTDTVWEPLTYEYVNASDYDLTSLFTFADAYEQADMIKVTVVDAVTGDEVQTMEVQRNTPVYVEVPDGVSIYTDAACTQDYNQTMLENWRTLGTELTQPADLTLYEKSDSVALTTTDAGTPVTTAATTDETATDATSASADTDAATTTGASSVPLAATTAAS